MPILFLGKWAGTDSCQTKKNDCTIFTNGAIYNFSAGWPVPWLIQPGVPTEGANASQAQARHKIFPMTLVVENGGFYGGIQ